MEPGPDGVPVSHADAFLRKPVGPRSLRTNIHGTENVVAAAARSDTRLLVASTSEIYGKNTTVGLREDDDRVTGSPLKSRWSYAEAKAIDESLVAAYAHECGLRAVIVRLFNTVGPRQSGPYGMVIPRFARQALAGEPLPLDRRWLWHVESWLAVAATSDTLRQLGTDLSEYLRETCQHHWMHEDGDEEIPAMRQCLWCHDETERQRRHERLHRLPAG